MAHVIPEFKKKIQKKKDTVMIGILKKGSSWQQTESIQFNRTSACSVCSDECRRPKKGRPRGGSTTNNLKLTTRRFFREALRRGFFEVKPDTGL